MKRKFISVTAALLAVTMLSGCSAYNNPRKYVTVPALSGLTISQAKINEKKKEQLDSLLDENRKPNYKEVSEAAKKGDQVKIDYEGKPTDGNLKLTEDTLKGMKAEGYELVLGSNAFIGAYSKDGKETHKGFEDQLIGAKAGDTVKVLVKFPDSYKTAALKGVEVEFTVKVHTVSRLTVEDDTLISVEYTFKGPELELDKGDKDETTDQPATSDKEEATGGSDTGADAASTTTSSSTDKKPELDDDEEKDDKTDFTKLFKDGKFSIDYAKEADDTKFNTIFKVSDYRDLFKGANLYQEFTKEVTIPKDVDEKFKDFAEKTITITFTVNSATILPEWNDELIKEISSETYTTTAAYEEALLKEIKIDLALAAVEDAAVYNGYPKSEAKKLYKEYVNQMVESTIGKSLDSVSASELKKLITDAEYQKIYASAATQSIAAVKSRLLIEYLCDELDVKLSNKEYKEQMEKTFKDYQADTSMMYYYYQYYGVLFSSAKDMESYFGKDSMELQFKTNKMSEELIKVIQIVD